MTTDPHILGAALAALRFRVSAIPISTRIPAGWIEANTTEGR